MSTVKLADGTSLNLPDEGSVFRDVGDNTGSSLYTIQGGKLVSQAQNTYVANTDATIDGVTYHAGDVIPRQLHAADILNKNYIGTYDSTLNASSNYDKTHGGGSYSALPTANIADINTAMQKLAGQPLGQSYNLSADPNNPNANVIQNAQGQTVSAPNAPGQAGAITPGATPASNANPNPTNPQTGVQGPPAGSNIQESGPAAGATGSPTGAATGYTGPSIVDYLASVGQASDFASRAKLAAAAGIQNYAGTAAQNTQLLNTLRTTNPGTNTNASGLTTGGTTQSGTGGNTGTSGTATTGAADPYAGLDPIQKQVKMYTDAATALGLPTIKQQMQSVIDQQTKLTDEMNGKIADANNNPWFSEGVRVNTIKKITDSYQTKLDTLSNLETVYDSLYKQGQAQVENIVSGAEADVKAANDLAQKQLDAATALAKDNQVVSIGGNEVLVNKSTGKTVAVLGPTPKSATADTKATTTQMNDDVQNAVSQLQQIVKTKNFAGIDPGDYQTMSDYLQKTYGTKAVSALKTAISALGLSVDVVGDGKGAN